MEDDLEVRGPIDRARINPHEAWEVDYWCHKFHIDSIQLKDALREVGNSAEAVEAYVARYIRRDVPKKL
ncbi:MAG: hypothetical protein JWN73_2683 [Betaproteobacteria bacterium]|nr:hypothetical protein [Betaproteobacteria bacterium]